MITHSILNNKGQYELMANGKNCVCPFRNPIPMQSNLGGVDMLTLSCNSSCPKFSLSENGSLALLCGSEKTVFEELEIKEPTSLKIVK